MGFSSGFSPDMPLFDFLALDFDEPISHEEWEARAEYAHQALMQRLVLARKYVVGKADGSDIDTDSKYFVIRYDAGAEHGGVGRSTLRRYACMIASSDIDLAVDLTIDIDAETQKAEGDRE